LRSLATTLGTLLVSALLLAGPGRSAAAPAAAVAPPSAPLPDSVLAAVGTRLITGNEFLRQWRGLAPGMRPPGPITEQTKSAFLDELVNKEVLTLAAEGAGYVPSAEESAQLANLRASLMRQEYYRREVMDGPAPAAGANRPADTPAQMAERESRLIERLVAPLRPRFDDGAAALLAGAFAKLPQPREQGPGWMRMQLTTWSPPVLPADTARVLATTTLGPFTIGRFLWFWERVPPAQRDRPDSAQAVVEWTKSFFAQGRIDAEAERLGFGRLPQVEAQLTARRRILAVESYYRTAVLARVDTSAAVLEAAWKRDPERFHGTPYDRYHGLWYPAETEAAAAVQALERGVAWDSLLAARYAAPDDAQLALLRRREADLYREPQVLAAGHSDSTLHAWFSQARPEQVFGPRERAGQWWVYRYLEHQDGKRGTFAEARPYVIQRVLAEGGEAQLTAHLAELRRGYDVRINAAALAALELPADPARPSPRGGGANPKE